MEDADEEEENHPSRRSFRDDSIVLDSSCMPEEAARRAGSASASTARDCAHDTSRNSTNDSDKAARYFAGI